MSYNSLVAAAYARWNGDGNADSTPDANDATGNGRDGTWSGTPGYGTGLWGGNSFLFDGSSEIARALGASGFTNKCMSVWMRCLNASNNDLNIIGIGEDTDDKLTLRLQANGAIKFVTQATAGNYGAGYDDGNWHHLVVVDNSSTSKLYVAGSELGSRASVGTYAALEINLGSNNFFGRLADNGMEMFDAIWHTADAWDTDDIAELMAGPEPVNTVAPTLSIDGSGNWTGTVGTWALPAPFAAGSNGTITYTWELRLDSDDSVVSSGSGASPSGSGLSSDTDYYLHVVAMNDGDDDLPAESDRESYVGSSGITGSLGVTLAGVSATATAEQTNAANAAATLAGVSGSAAAEQTNAGTLAATLAGVSGSAAAEQTNEANAAATLSGVSGSAAAEQLNAGTLAATLAGVSVLAEGAAGEQVAGQLAVTLAGVSGSAAGQQLNAATLSVSLAGVSGAAAAEQTNAGDLAVTLAGVGVSASGEGAGAIGGSLAVTLAGCSSSAAAESTIEATLAVALGGVHTTAQAALAIRAQFGVGLQGVSVVARSGEGQTRSMYYLILGA